MPAHQFPSRWSLFPRPSRVAEINASQEPRFRSPYVRDRGGSQTELPRFDPPPAYTEPTYHARRYRSASRTAPPVAESLKEEKRKGSWNVVETVEQKYWQLSSSKNAVLRWSLEIFSWSVSAVCMITIIILLTFTGGKERPSWPIDAYVSVISRVATSALLLPTAEAIGELKWSYFQRGSSKKKMWDFEVFDAATRGPMGSLTLLLRLKGGSLAALGAAIMLLTVGLDPFFQQVVTLSEREILQTGQHATIPRARWYSADDSVSMRQGVRLNMNDPHATVSYEDFLYGIETRSAYVGPGPGTIANIPLVCPTSNCTWPSYESLAVCSQCANIESLLTYACMPTRTDWVSSVNVSAKQVRESWPRANACGYFLNATSADPMLVAGYKVNDDHTPGEALVMRLLDLMNVGADNYTLWNGSLNFANMADKFADFLVLGVDGFPSGIYTNSSRITAHECALNWCVNTYSSKYHQGRYEENVIQSYYNDTLGASLLKIDYNVTGVVIRDVDIVITPPYLEGGDSFGMTGRTSMQQSVSLHEIIPGFVTLSNASAPPMLRYWNYGVGTSGAGWSRHFDNNPWLPPTNITARMEKLAIALSSAMRATNSTEWIDGEAYATKVFLIVGWAWLTLPLLVLLASFAFLVATVIHSSKGPQTWKNSAVATLMHALPEEVQKRLNDSNPRALANELTIKLAPDRGGWRMSYAMESTDVAPRASSPSRRQGDRSGRT